MHEPIRYDRHLSATEQTHFVYGSAEPGRPTYPRKFTASIPHMINVRIWYVVQRDWPCRFVFLSLILFPASLRR